MTDILAAIRDGEALPATGTAHVATVSPLRHSSLRPVRSSQ